MSVTWLPRFKALADETRLRLLAILRSGPFHVNELVRILAMGQSRVSRHLRVLHDAGLVTLRREGSRVYYSLSDLWTDPGPLADLGRDLDDSATSDRHGIAQCFARRRESASHFFRDAAPRWDDERDRVQGPQHHLRRIVETVDALAAPLPERRHGDDLITLVDLGTGTGVLLPLLAPRAHHLIGIDASAEMLEGARETARHHDIPSADLRLGTLEHLPLSDGEADIMVANLVLHHVASPPEAIREIARGLEPGGGLVIADFERHDRESWREQLGDLWLGFSPDELRSWLSDAGLDVDPIERITADDLAPETHDADDDRAEAGSSAEPTPPPILLCVAHKPATRALPTLDARRRRSDAARPRDDDPGRLGGHRDDASTLRHEPTKHDVAGP